MLINIFKTVLKDENEADKMLMVEDYPQVWYTDKKHHFYPQNNSKSEQKKDFSILCFAQQLTTNLRGFEQLQI